MTTNKEKFVEFKLAKSKDKVHINPAQVLFFNKGKTPEEENSVYICLSTKQFWYVDATLDEVASKLNN